jgi:hypothetical protein
MARTGTNKSVVAAKNNKIYFSFEELQKKHPDSWVLLENPKFNAKNTKIIGGIFYYKHKNRDRVYAKAALLHLDNITVIYTGGKLDETALHFVL